MPRILIIEPDMSGHRSAYLHWIIQAALERGLQVTLAASVEGTQHPAMEELQRHVGDRCKMVALPRAEVSTRGLKARLVPPHFQTQLINYNFWAKAYRRVPNADFVFVAALDGCLYNLAAWGPPFSGAQGGAALPCAPSSTSPAWRSKARPPRFCCV